MTATTLLVVPRSIPMILDMVVENLRLLAQRMFAKIRNRRLAARPGWLPKRLLSISLFLVLNFSVSLSSFGAKLTVAAASDLAPVSAELRAEFEKRSGHKVNWINGSSGLFARQIEAGAPFDVFLSADEKIVQDLGIGGFLSPDAPVVYARGRLALWGKRLPVKLSDLESPAIRFIAIANPAHAPYGRAAKDFLERRGIWPKLRDHVVYGESVLQTYQLAATSNAELCIVAWPQVMDKGGLPLDPDAHLPLRQTAAIPKRAASTSAARDLLAFLKSPAGQAILQAHGFLAP
jgi:molybdate transport system substrate-binding protein